MVPPAIVVMNEVHGVEKNKISETAIGNNNSAGENNAISLTLKKEDEAF